jgi:hypothetical protein
MGRIQGNTEKEDAGVGRAGESRAGVWSFAKGDGCFFFDMWLH